MTDSKKIKELELRIEKLEKIILGSKIKKSTKEVSEYVGLTGGLNLLLDQGFFNKPVLVTEVLDDLKREGYFYSLQAVDTILRRNMVAKKRILTRMKIDGLWQYVIRK